MAVFSSSAFQRLNEQRIALPVLALVILLLVAGPLAMLFYISLLPANALPFTETALGLGNYLRLVTQSDSVLLITNTLLYAGGSVAVAVTIATGIAFLTERSDLPLRGSLRIVLFSFMAMPPLVTAFGWILLLNPGNGAINLFLQDWLDLDDAPFSIYSLSAMIAISGLGLVPSCFAMVAGLLRALDAQLEGAAATSGAGRFTVLRTITLPLMTPGLASIAIYLVMVMIQAFDVPLVIGITARVPMLSTRIYLLSSADKGLPDYGLSAAFGMLLVAIALGLMAGYFRMIRLGEQFRTVTGKARRAKRITLGPWRPVALGLVALYVGIMLLPILILIWTSLLPFYQTPSVEALSDLSFGAYAQVLSGTTTLKALTNTLILVFSSASLVMLLSLLISWFAIRQKSRISRLIDTLSFMPIAIPHIVIALAILVLYIRTPLHGTLWVLVLAHVTIYLAFGTRTMNAALLQIHRELESAALVSGASWSTMLRLIVVPLLAPQIIAGWLWVVAHSARDLTVPLVLMTTNNLVVASLLYLLWQFPNLPGAAALSILMLGGLLVIVVPLQIFAFRRFEQRS